MHIKICGITQSRELELLGELGVTYAGLWFGTRQGRSNLELNELERLCALPRGRLQVVLVTIDIDPGDLANLISRVPIDALQLHGFQLPKRIDELRRSLPTSIKLFKALHVRDGHCLEERFITQYLTAGVDHFVIDSFVSTKDIGSTGVKLSTPYVIDFLTRNDIADRTLIAGGIDMDSIVRLSAIPGLYGFDIDSSVKVNNRIDKTRLHEIVTCFRHASGAQISTSRKTGIQHDHSQSQ